MRANYLRIFLGKPGLFSNSVFQRGPKVSALLCALAISAGCLDRPVSPASPHTTNVFVDNIQYSAIDKMDLLFVIDNSVSMADKQTFLARAVPALLRRFQSPLCVSDDGEQTQPGPNCPQGFVREFEAVDDIHVGVVTSSLGGHGADSCSAAASDFNPTQDDRAWLLPTVRDGLTGADDQGFLAWDPRGQDAAQREDEQRGFLDAFAAQVTAAGESGCGFEATLESFYRFLIDPEPPDTISVDPLTGAARVEGVDQTILAQRAAFLRPDSLVAIILLSDENDCSIVDGGVGWLTSARTHEDRPFRMPAATQSCATDPNNVCCRSCALEEASGPPAGCQPLGSDAGCASTLLDSQADPLNLRCYDQKRRFGWDLLYPTSRYVEGLKSPTVHKRDGTLAPNPLYQAGEDGKTGLRDANIVFLAGIVGVPWQDIATPDSLTPDGALKYLSAKEISELGRWSMLVPTAGAPPSDPFMIETPEARSGENPITDDPITSFGTWNSINGHEAALLGEERDDLQYACIFPLDAARSCVDQNGQDIGGCDCGEGDRDKARPLCEAPGGAAITETTQYYAKAYPGTRQLELLRDFGENSIVSSICPKLTGSNTEDPGYGYNPAVSAIVDRLKVPLQGRCLPRELDVVDGSVPCAVVEATRTPTSCAEPGRGPVNETLIPTVMDRMQQQGSCGKDTGISCDSFSFCQIEQLQGEQATLCKTEQDPLGVTGYCYVDPAKDAESSESLVRGCPASERRLLHFVGDDTPKNGSTTFIACVGAGIEGK